MFLLLLAAGTRYLVFGEPLESFTLFSAALVMLGLTLCFDLARRWHAYA